MRWTRFLPLAALTAAIFAWPGHACAQSAVQLTPVFIDKDHGYVYFLVRNRSAETINNLFGWVYGYGSEERPGTHLINNPHAQGMKVSLGDHVPGSVAMYRFMIPENWMNYPRFSLLVADDGLFYPRKAGQ